MLAATLYKPSTLSSFSLQQIQRMSKYFIERPKDLSVDDFQSACPLKKIKENEELTLISDLILRQKGHQLAIPLGFQPIKGLGRAQNVIQNKMGNTF